MKINIEKIKNVPYLKFLAVVLGASLSDTLMIEHNHLHPNGLVDITEIYIKNTLFNNS